MKNVLAFDLGASSGRAVAAAFDGKTLSLSEVHRFANEPVMLGSTFYWDTLRLLHEIKTGISKANLTGTRFDSLGVDTWGVDFGLLRPDGRLVDNSVHYRDARNAAIPAEVFSRLPAREIYASTGIQTMDLNTLFQLYYLATREPEQLERADSLLFTPDLLNFFLSGVRAAEYSIASTSQLLDARARTWDDALFEKLGLPRRLMQDIVAPGTTLGRLTPAICDELNVPALDIVASAGHDTAAAVAAVPHTDGSTWAYLSSGTWSLLGLELDEPVLSDAAFEANFTNEGGVNRTTRFLKNIIGLWLMQETRRAWIRESGPISFREIDALTEKASPLVRFIDPDYPEFSRPGNMPRRFDEYLARTGQAPCTFRGDYSRMITESLALKYRTALENLERVTGRHIDVLHVIGGGVQDRLLCQCTANAIGRPVVAGPIEATAIGNCLVQLLASGEFASLAEARACVRDSFPITVYEPQDAALWDDAYARFTRITEQ